jgi:hypothetical protein
VSGSRLWSHFFYLGNFLSPPTTDCFICLIMQLVVDNTNSRQFWLISFLYVKFLRSTNWCALAVRLFIGICWLTIFTRSHFSQVFSLTRWIKRIRNNLTINIITVFTLCFSGIAKASQSQQGHTYWCVTSLGLESALTPQFPTMVSWWISVSYTLSLGTYAACRQGCAPRRLWPQWWSGYLSS